jgi:flagellar motility protein MotE (MotC chaperone)
MYTKVTAALVAALALSVASCGSSKPVDTASQATTTTSKPPLHQSPFAAQVDAVCQHEQLSMGVILREIKKTGVAASKAHATSLLREEAASLERLQAPADLRADYAVYKASLRARLASLTEASKGNAKQTTSNEEEIRRSEKEHRAIRRIGLTRCF